MQEKHITEKIHESYPYTDIIFGTHTLHKFPQDLLKFGLIPEFVGRLPIVATLKALDKQGITEMTSVQARAIPILSAGKDLIGKSQTGTGKTFAFGDVSNPEGAYTYIVDNNGNAILRVLVKSAEYQMKGKDLSTKKMLIFKGDENTLEVTRIFSNGEAMAYKDVLELLKRAGTDRQFRAMFDKMKPTVVSILSNIAWQITYVTEDEVDQKILDRSIYHLALVSDALDGHIIRQDIGCVIVNHTLHFTTVLKNVVTCHHFQREDGTRM